MAASIVESSLQLADIALNSPRMKQFAYTSTAYANSYLHHLHTGIDTIISEQIHPVRPGSGDNPSMALFFKCFATLILVVGHS